MKRPSGIWQIGTSAWHERFGATVGRSPKLLRRSSKSAPGWQRPTRGTFQLQRDLATAYENRGTVEKGVSPYFFKSLEIRTKLVAGSPQSTPFKHDLAILYEKMGTHAVFANFPIPLSQMPTLFEQAREFYRRDLEIAKELAAAHPADRALQHDLAVCYEKLSRVCRWDDRKQEACEYRRLQLAILTKLTAAEPRKSRDA